MFRSLTILVLALLAGCADRTRERSPLQSQIGKNCVVYFRRDALGMAADIPSSPTTGRLNGADVQQVGQLMESSAEWVVLNLHGQVYHIPRAAILMIEFGSNITQSPGLSQPVEKKAPDHGDHTHSDHGDQTHPPADHSH